MYILISGIKKIKDIFFFTLQRAENLTNVPNHHRGRLFEKFETVSALYNPPFPQWTPCTVLHILFILVNNSRNKEICSSSIAWCR